MRLQDFTSVCIHCSVLWVPHRIEVVIVTDVSKGYTALFRVTRLQTSVGILLTYLLTELSPS
jgi:hypothetical protein